MRSQFAFAVPPSAAPIAFLLCLALTGCERLDAEDSAHLDRLERLALVEDSGSGTGNHFPLRRDLHL